MSGAGRARLREAGRGLALQGMVKSACPVCDSERATFLFHGRDRAHDIPGEFEFFRCANCAAIFYEPRLDRKALAAYYPDSYGRYRVSRSLDRKDYRGIRRFVLEHYYGYPSGHGAKRGRLLKPAAFFLAALAARGAIPFRGEGNLLDIGCGGGSFLYRLKGWGWNVYGVEPSPAGAAAARSLGLDVYHGELAEARYPAGFFDVVRLHHVLEHLPDPRETFLEISRTLKPDGIVLVTVPNTQSLNFRLFGPRWYALEAPRHVVSYAPKTLGILCSTTGFEIEKLCFRSGSFNFVRSVGYLLGEKHHLGFGLLRRVDWKRNKFVRRTLKPFFCLVDFLGYGDVMQATVRKASIRRGGEPEGGRGFASTP